MDAQARGGEVLESFRGPLFGLCYRMTGSVEDAEDAVQETLLRAHRSIAQYDPSRARMSTWLHAIATNVCLDSLRAARRRALLLDPGATTDAPGLGDPVEASAWIEPMPTSRVELVGDPADLVVSRESVRLAFLAALQLLPPRQRAVLILRDVLAHSAQETAQILGMSVAAVTSALQRARRTMAERCPQRDGPPDVGDPEVAGLVDRFSSAFAAHDVAGLVALLHDDAVASMPPFAWVRRGGHEIALLMARSESCAGARLVPCGINGGIGFGQYRPGAAGVLEPFALVALGTDRGRIEHVVTFLGTAGRFAEFGLPPSLSAAGVPAGGR